MANKDLRTGVTSIHEDIIREVEETDWTVDPAEDEDLCSMSETPAVDQKTQQVKNGCTEENEDDDFDVDELECVDEAAEDDRRDRERYERRHRYPRDEPSRHLNAREKYRPPSYHPYSRKDHSSRLDYHSSRGSHRSDRRFDAAGHRMSPPKRVTNERSSNRRFQHMRSTEHGRLKTTEREENDIPFEDLELEEVDCYDEVGSGDSDYGDTTSASGESHTGEYQDPVDVKLLPRVHGGTDVDDDFPDLCEDIDVDAMRRAAAAADVVLPDYEPESSHVNSSPSTRQAPASNGFGQREDARIRNYTTSSSARGYYRVAGRDDRRDEARHRHHHYVGRDKHGSTRYSRTEHVDSKSTGADRHRERSAATREARPSTSSGIHHEESHGREDSAIISVKGPLARGWCTGEEEEEEKEALRSNVPTLSKPDSESSSRSKYRVEAVTDGAKRKADDGEEGSPSRHSKVHRASSPSRRKHSDSTRAEADSSLKSEKDSRRDSGSYHSRRDVRSPKRTATTSHFQQKSATANDITEKIPSLLDICIDEPPPSSQSVPSSLPHDSVSRDSLPMSASGKQHQRNAREHVNEGERVVPKTRSLLDLDLPPPDRDTMRRYAIVLNGYELTKRHSRSRTGHKPEPRRTPASSPRRTDRHERPRQPRSYVNGLRR
ncbi:hypothetical protein Q1695_006896 [Nippostrongylus brasiliensis]|nr:hypothetical protein Q1695_006896 [Nippostrongylus brasiliensis]